MNAVAIADPVHEVHAMMMMMMMQLKRTGTMVQTSECVSVVTMVMRIDDRHARRIQQR